MLRIAKRFKILLIIGLIVLIGLTGRMFYIQFMCHDELQAGAAGQQIVELKGSDNMGIIYDRNMIKLTDSSPNFFYLVNRKYLEARLTEAMEKIGAEVVGAKGNDYIVYKSSIYNSEITKELNDKYGVYSFECCSRYSDKQIAVHLVNAIDNMYKNRLTTEAAMLTITGNGIGNPIKGEGIRVNALRKRVDSKSFVTTIDSNLQDRVENILASRGDEGAVIVLDTKTGQVLSMASSPSFNPNKIETYLDSDGGELINKAMQGQYPPGSVFKIAVAAAALESGKITLEQQFNCNGKININGVTLTCEDRKQGHGKLNLEQAFAQSCNCYFAQLGRKIGAKPILEMASKLGLGQETITGYPNGALGNIPSKEESSYSGISNLSIGQGSLLVTPMQIARMTNVIANEGVDKGISITIDGSKTTEKTIMNQETASKIGEMMADVVTEGTGMGQHTDVTIAGKTGSAETTENGANTVHCWFTGYFPKEDPRYTVTVLIENGKTGSTSALPVFADICNFLY